MKPKVKQISWGEMTQDFASTSPDMVFLRSMHGKHPLGDITINARITAYNDYPIYYAWFGGDIIERSTHLGEVQRLCQDHLQELVESYFES